MNSNYGFLNFQFLPDNTEIINKLEHGDNSVFQNWFSENYVEAKILEFLDQLNSSYRLNFLNCTRRHKEKFIYLLLLLKRSIKYALEELGQGLSQKTRIFNCTKCNERVMIRPNENFWKSLQEHEHFENLYCDFLKGNLDEPSLTNESEESDGSSTEQNMKQSSITTGIENLSLASENDENVNSFRFNFPLKYHAIIEAKFYPPSIMSGVRKFDQVEHCTMQRCGPSRAFCLICHCNMNSVRVSKHALVNHALGQRHLKASKDPRILELLDVYHEFWLQQDPSMQAHQIYMRPDKKTSFYCSLCSVVVKLDSVIPHIMGNIHMDKVMDIYSKKNNEFHLTDMQVACYGIVKEEKQSEEIPKKERKFSHRSKDRNKSRKPEIDNSPPLYHNIIRSVEKSESRDILDLIPNRMKSQVVYFKILRKPKGLSVYCELCKCGLAYDLETIKSHICMASYHINLKEKYKYYCEICDKWDKSELEWSQHDFKGRRHVNMADTRKAKVTEYECTTCKQVIFGDELSISRHLPNNSRSSRNERTNKLPDAVQAFLKSREVVEVEGAKLVRQAEEVLTASDTRMCCEALEKALSEKFEGCKVYPFGSRISGIGNKKSDLDVFVDTGNMYYGHTHQEPKDQVAFIRKANKVFSKIKDYNNFNQVLTARTPILTLHHLPSNIDCDLSFKHGLSVENTAFLKFCMQLQPITQPFILLVKKWATCIVLENVSTYALAIMCIFFLQDQGFMPSVERLREIQGEGIKVGGWKTINYTLTVDETKQYVEQYPRSKTLDALLKDFFNYYAKFNFNTYVVCPLLGRVVKKSQFYENGGKNLPEEMEEYLAQLENEDAEVFKSTAFMCIQDPFDLSHNLTKAMQQGTLKIFENMCKLTAKQLNFE